MTNYVGIKELKVVISKYYSIFRGNGFIKLNKAPTKRQT